MSNLIRQKGLVLFGHGVTRHKTDPYIEHLHDNFNGFKQALEIFEYLGFAFISMADLLILAQHNFQYDRHWLHLTFDDGYQNIYTLAYPYLKAKKIPFSLFVSTYHIENHERYYTYRIRCAVLNTRQEINLSGFKLLAKNASRAARIRFCQKVITRFKMMGQIEVMRVMAYIDSLLSADEWVYYHHLYSDHEVLTVGQLQSLAGDELVHIGSHGHRHLVLNQNVSNNDILTEMQSSKTWLQKHLGVDGLTYSYPNGTKNDFTPTAKRLCQNLDYQLAFTTIKQPISAATDRYEMPRFNLPIGYHQAAWLWGRLILNG